MLKFLITQPLTENQHALDDTIKLCNKIYSELKNKLLCKYAL